MTSGWCVASGIRRPVSGAGDSRRQRRALSLPLLVACLLCCLPTAGITIKNWEDGSPTSYSCLYGAWCGRLQKGKTKAQIGYVAPRCASPPPPGRPVVCPTGGEPQKVSIDAIRRSTVDGYFEGSPPTIDFVESAQECRKKALAARCRGERVSFFLYTPDSSAPPHPLTPPPKPLVASIHQ